MNYTADQKERMLGYMLDLSSNDPEKYYAAIDAIREIMDQVDDRPPDMKKVRAGIRIDRTIWIDKCGEGKFAAYDTEGVVIPATLAKDKPAVLTLARAMMREGGLLEHVHGIATMVEPSNRQGKSARPRSNQGTIDVQPSARPQRSMRAGSNE